MTEPVQPLATAPTAGGGPPRRTRREYPTPTREARAEAMRRMVRDESKVRLNLNGTRPLRTTIVRPD